MRHLAPHPAPTELTNANPPLPLDWNNPSAQVRQAKRAIRDKLYRHQFGLCGFCEGSLGELKRHTEHVEPKGGTGGNPARTFDYSNLIASCQGEQKTGQSADSCGHFKNEYIGKEGAFILADFVSPREAGCDATFKYLSDGRVVPSAAQGTDDYRRADYTIKVAGLDCNRLRNRRRQIAERLLRQIHRFQNEPHVLQRLLNHYLGTHLDSDGGQVLLSFYSTRKQRLAP